MVKDDNLLHVAAFCSNIEVMKFLLEKSADANANDKNGRTPFDLSKTKETKEMLKLSH
ncbi:ankyrin repeat domain-containing protein [Bacteroidetes bacterium endosymbiont of Geopemphigus sp.]|uniref:ankyrin repeat domain-containing protein n=1 Tax=Bacteroidetes bacterium endosymbiont of Geopemphigus sp. TaxID=2047937 RepID=UPI003977DDA4